MPGILKSAPGMPRFVASSSRDRVAHIAQRLASLHDGAIDRHERLTHRVGVPELFRRRGHLHLYQDSRSIDQDLGWRLRELHGYRFERLDRAGLLALELRIGPRYQAVD